MSRYESGVDRGVFYPAEGPGVEWNGLVSVTENEEILNSGASHQDGRKMHQRHGNSSFSGTIEAYTYPDELEAYNGDYIFVQSRRIESAKRETFNLSYRTMTENGYKLHVLYNVLLTPTTTNRESLSQEQNAALFTWGFSTKPVYLPNAKPSAHLYVESNDAYPWLMEELENILYGTESTPARLPSIDEVLSIFENASILKITNHGDGTFTAEGPDDVVYFTDPTTFEINWPSVIYIDADTYQASSL